MTTEAKWSDFTSLDGPKSIAAANSLLPPWVSLALVVVIGWQLARIIWSLVPGPSAGDIVDIPAGSLAQVSAANTSADAETIAVLHLFGEADDEAVIVQTEVFESDNLPDTGISSLELKGTITSDVAEMSVAIISDGNKDEKVHTIGATVVSGTTLTPVLNLSGSDIPLGYIIST